MAIENLEHATSSYDLLVYNPITIPKSSFTHLDNTKDKISTYRLIVVEHTNI